MIDRINMADTKEVFAGFTEIDITPSDFRKCELIGFNRSDSFARGVLHPLKAQVLILKDSNQICCLITVDTLSFSTALTDQLRDSIAEQLHGHRKDIMVCFSHTHAAPDAAANNAAYFMFAKQKIIAAVDLAFRTTFPIKAAWGIAENTIGINRRSDADATDPRIGILKISNAATDETQLLLLRVTAHANVLSSDNYLISSDYFGPTRALLEETYHCKVMMTQGASGDVISKHRQENADFLEKHPLEAAKVVHDEAAKKSIFNESIEALNKNAAAIKSAVAAVYDEIEPTAIHKLSMYSETLTFKADVPTLERAQTIAAEAAFAGIDGSDWLEEVKSLNTKGIQIQTSQREAQFLTVNNGCLCGIADEAMCEIAIDIKERAQDDFIFFGGYTNGYEGYLPTAASYDKGGYEVLWSNLIYYKYYHRVMPFNRDTADHLAKQIVQIWQRILTS
ncbi:MAG: hypothetical protein PWP51_1591 [Clostridiales bacterium]|jgi:hypothetical protein|nr:hypothetical protein [Clostridiales bacterium]MDN5299038.1 hypothetical protein [Clostridiales bacterium]